MKRVVEKYFKALQLFTRAQQRKLFDGNGERKLRVESNHVRNFTLTKEQF